MSQKQSKAALAKEGTARVRIAPQASGSGRVVRLNDPEVKPQVDQVIANITSSKEKSIAFLHKAGILTKGGRLSRKYGG